MDHCLSYTKPIACIKSSDPSEAYLFSVSKITQFVPRRLSYGLRSRRKRVAVVIASASGSCKYGSSLNTPHEPRSSTGRLLSTVFQNQRQSFNTAVTEQLERLAMDRDGAVARMKHSTTYPESCLHRRIAEMKVRECRNAVEDVMYMLIIYKFSDIRVALVPTLSQCIYNSRLEIWPSKDWELKSIHGYEALDVVRDHVSAVTGLKARAGIADEWATTSVAHTQLFKSYNESLSFGYFLKSSSRRHCLDSCLSSILDHCSVTRLLPGGFGDPTESFARYLDRFDEDALQRCAMLRSKEAIDLVEKHSWALFGDGEEEKMISASFSSIKRLVLEAVAFGSFLWDVEEQVDRVYKLDMN